MVEDTTVLPSENNCRLNKLNVNFQYSECPNFFTKCLQIIVSNIEIHFSQCEVRYKCLLLPIIIKTNLETFMF